MVKVIVFIAAVFLTAVSCYPARDAKEEVEIVPLERQFPFRPNTFDSDEDFGDQPIVDTGYFNSYVGNPFGGLFESLQSMLTRMRHQLATALSHIPHGNGTDIIGFPSFGDLGEGNTTSVTKIIDGHKVVINETEYKKDGENGGAFVRIVKINVVPDGTESIEHDTEHDTEPDTEPETKPTGKDRESLEDSVENEIPKVEEGIFDNLESFDMDVNNSPVKNNELEELNNVPNNLLYSEAEPIRDLSNDININYLPNDMPYNPDAEDIFDAELYNAKFKMPKFERFQRL